MEKYLLQTVKALEALNILKKSDYRQFENKRVEITKDIFNSIRNNSKPKSKESEVIADNYLRRFRYPLFTSLSKYEPLDLILALNHHYLNDLGSDAYQLSDVNITMTQANTIAKALFEDFDPMSIPTDLESKLLGRMGEFKRYVGKGHIFHMAIEGKRSGQYTALGLPSYYDSVRYAVIESEAAKLTAERMKRFPVPEIHDTVKTIDPLQMTAEVDELEITEVDIQEDDFSDDTSYVDPSSFVDETSYVDDTSYSDDSSYVDDSSYEDSGSYVDDDDPTKDDDDWTRI